ncbi:DUF4221 family protein [Pararhodonellum marinum]|uniref:DUF4221 family protein n=1 Tax=Pararhodonellum marinum TaxID=2755358 RepID=UPI00188DF1E3|nr:DUF4221 family protein [Pararhodonellum marinum]
MRWIYFIAICCAFSCGKKSQTLTYKLKKTGEVSLVPEGIVFVNPSLAQLVESDSGKYLFFYNSIGKNYLFMDFQTGKTKVEIPMNTNEGPNSLRGRTGGFLTTIDSIWMTFAPAGIGLVNFNGELLLKRKVENDLFPVSALMSDLHRPIIQRGNKLFGPQPYFMNHHGMDKADIRKHQLIYSYDIKSDVTEWYDVFYSDDYWDKGKKLTDFSWAHRENKLYLSPLYDHEIQVFDMNSGKIEKKKVVKSKHINRFNYVDAIPSSIHEGLSGDLSFDKYNGLIYDPYREVLYRLFLPGVELIEEDMPVEKMRMLNWSRPYMGVMILDLELNVLGEHLFEKNEVYTFSNFFVGKDGLYLSANNHFNEGYTEDSLRYAVFSLEKQ